MQIKVDLEKGRCRLTELEPEPANIGLVPEELRQFYTERDGRCVLDTELRDALVAEFDRMIEREKLKAERDALREAKHRAVVAETVKAALLKAGVAPKLARAAFHSFMAEHKIAARDRPDGGVDVRVVGARGAEDAELAAIKFLRSDDGDAFADAPASVEADGPLSTAMRALLH